MSAEQPALDEHGPPVVLRHRVGPPGTGPSPGEETWELVDPWGPPQAACAASAVTRRSGGLAVLVAMSIDAHAAPGTAEVLVQQLVAMLRRTGATVVCCSITDPVVRDVLLTAGFVPLPEDPPRDASRTPRLILQLT